MTNGPAQMLTAPRSSTLVKASSGLVKSRLIKPGDPRFQPRGGGRITLEHLRVMSRDDVILRIGEFMRTPVALQRIAHVKCEWVHQAEFHVGIVVSRVRSKHHPA